jgi:hypothetical protein
MYIAEVQMYNEDVQYEWSDLFKDWELSFIFEKLEKFTCMHQSKQLVLYMYGKYRMFAEIFYSTANVYVMDNIV